MALVKRRADEGQGRVSAWLWLRQIMVCSEALWRTFGERSADELDLLGRRDVSVGHCPNGNFRIGPPKAHALQRAGVRVGALPQHAEHLHVGRRGEVGVPIGESSGIGRHGRT